MQTQFQLGSYIHASTNETHSVANLQDLIPTKTGIIMSNTNLLVLLLWQWKCYTCDLPDMYAFSPWACRLWAYISGKSLMPMLQLLHVSLFSVVMHDSGNVEMMQYHDNRNITISYNNLMGIFVFSSLGSLKFFVILCGGYKYAIIYM